MLHDGVGTWVQDGLVPGVTPAHDVWRVTVGPAHLEYLAVAVQVAAMGRAVFQAYYSEVGTSLASR